MSNNKNSGRRTANTGATSTTESQDLSKELGKELVTGTEGQQSGELKLEQGTVSTQTSLNDGPAETAKVVKTPNFATKQAPTSQPRLVKLFKQLVGEYAKGNTSRSMDQASAKQVTRGLCTGFHNFGKLNANDVKVCLTVLNEAIEADEVGAFSEGVMFRHATATSHSRLFIDMLNLAKRYVSLGKGKANIVKVVDVDACAEHYTIKVVQAAIVDFYK